MDVIRESIENACIDFDTRDILDDKKLCADTIKVLAEAYEKVVKADVEKAKADNAHEEKLEELKVESAKVGMNLTVQDAKDRAEADIQKKKIESDERMTLAKLDFEKEKLKSETDIQKAKIESEERQANAKIEVEKDKVFNEAQAAEEDRDLKAEDLEQKRKDKLASDIIAFVGTATTAAVGVAGVVGARKNLLDVMKFEETGKVEHIPITTAFRLLWNKRK